MVLAQSIATCRSARQAENAIWLRRLSTPGSHLLAGRGKDLGKPVGGFKSGKFRRQKPTRLGQFLVENNVAGDPSRREGENDEMSLDPAFGVARDHLAITGQRQWLDFEARFLADFAGHRLLERFPKLDSAPRQRMEAVGRRQGPAYDQNAAVADDGGTDREIRARWITSRLAAGAGQEPIPSGYYRNGCQPSFAEHPFADRRLRISQCAPVMSSRRQRMRSGRCSSTTNGRISRRDIMWRRPSQFRLCGWSTANARSRSCDGDFFPRG